MKKNKTLKFLVVADLHGVKPKILVDLETIDAIICPGDICGDDLRPYIKKWIKARSNYEEELEFDDFCSPIKQKYYNKISLIKGRKVLRYLNKLGKPVFLVPGNWDQVPHLDGGRSNIRSRKIIKKNPWTKLKRGLKNIKDIENKKINFRGIILIGHGAVSAPELLKKPLKSKIKDSDLFNQEIKRYKYFSKLFPKLEKLFKSSKNPIIHLTHNVPYQTKLDKVNAPGTYAHNKHYGSIIARKLIDKFEPMLCIGGHIHEGYGKTRLKKTLCINAGFGADVNTIVEIDVTKGKVLKIEFLGKNKEN